MVGGRLLLLECREHMYGLFYQKKGLKNLLNFPDEQGLYTLYRRPKNLMIKRQPSGCLLLNLLNSSI